MRLRHLGLSAEQKGEFGGRMMLHCSMMRFADMEDITATIERALRAAGLDPTARPMADASHVIARALRDAGLSPQAHTTPFSPMAPDLSLRLPAGAASAPQARVFGRSAPERSDDARFTVHLHAQGKASRRYKLYVPTSATGAAMPLIVMLHGCKQDPDDFADGTRMNQLAERHRFVVAYPAQSVGANGNNCWNWFHGSEQTRAGIEASLIAGITRSIADRVPIDERRVFVAGLSAGAAMAVILGANYPEVFAGVAAHSGLPLEQGCFLARRPILLRAGSVPSRLPLRRR